MPAHPLFLTGNAFNIKKTQMHKMWLGCRKYNKNFVHSSVSK